MGLSVLMRVWVRSAARWAAVEAEVLLTPLMGVGVNEVCEVRSGGGVRGCMLGSDGT